MNKATEDPLVIEVYQGTLEKVQEIYGKDLLAAYLLGSLAHGGFSQEISDIDVAFILDGEKITDDDWKNIRSVGESIKDSTKLGNKISIFWSTMTVLSKYIPSGTYPTITKQYGVFPPYDMADLIQNGLLFYGQDIRRQVRIPTKEDLYIGGVELSLSFMDTRDRVNEIIGKQRFMNLDNHDISKRILYPARLSYTLYTGKVGNNEEAAAYYMENLPLLNKQGIITLIRHALDLRLGRPRDGTILSNNFPLVRAMYLQLIEQYLSKMKELQHSAHVYALEEWYEKLLKKEVRS